jgi:hypothetical protein
MDEGSEICVTGSLVTIQGRSFFIARHINDQHSLVVLRTKNGRFSRTNFRKLPEENDFVCVVASAADRI